MSLGSGHCGHCDRSLWSPQSVAVITVIGRFGRWGQSDVETSLLTEDSLFKAIGNHYQCFICKWVFLF